MADRAIHARAWLGSEAYRFSEEEMKRLFVVCKECNYHLEVEGNLVYEHPRCPNCNTLDFPGVPVEIVTLTDEEETN